MKLSRKDGREADVIRPVNIVLDYQSAPLASVLIETGSTRVICAVNDDDKVPPFLENREQGWVTAEYSLLPSSTNPRTQRESIRGTLYGRTMEIQRMIGRCLRSVTKLNLLGQRTLRIDCDCIQADGGTRTASITGAFIALVVALDRLRAEGKLGAGELPVTDYVAGISLGINEDGDMLLDLDYSEDSTAVIDLNIVRTGAGKYVEIQGGAEKAPFSHDDFLKMLKLADMGIDNLIEKQKEVIGKLL